MLVLFNKGKIYRVIDKASEATACIVLLPGNEAMPNCSKSKRKGQELPEGSKRKFK